MHYVSGIRPSIAPWLYFNGALSLDITAIERHTLRPWNTAEHHALARSNTSTSFAEVEHHAALSSVGASSLHTRAPRLGYWQSIAPQNYRYLAVDITSLQYNQRSRFCGMHHGVSVEHRASKLPPSSGRQHGTAVLNMIKEIIVFRCAFATTASYAVEHRDSTSSNRAIVYPSCLPFDRGNLETRWSIEQ